MLLPQSLTDVLAEMRILGLPGQQDAGVPLAPTLTSLDAITGLAQGTLLARLDFGQVALSLSNARLDFGQIEWLLSASAGKTLGQVSLEGLFESVEVPKPASTTAAAVDPDQSALRERPYAVPATSSTGLIYSLNQNVAAEIGKVRGAIELAERMTGTAIGDLTGRLTGQLTADIRTPPLLDVVPEVKVEWRVTDAANRPVAVHVPTGEPGLNTPAPVFAFVPEFTEYSGGTNVFSERRVSCEVTVTRPDDTVLAQRVIGPVTVLVPQVQIPSLLVMTEHALDSGSAPGDVLIAVPSSAALDLLDLEHLVALLSTLQTTLQRLQGLLGLALGDMVSAVGDVLGWITSNRVTTLKQTELHDLSAVERDPGGFLGWGATSWEDCISAIVLIGPPGRSITVHNRRNLWIGTGAIRVRVAPLRLLARVPRLDSPTPAVSPEGAEAQVFGLQPPSSFNDVISSFAFEPLALLPVP